MGVIQDNGTFVIVAKMPGREARDHEDIFFTLLSLEIIIIICF